MKGASDLGSSSRDATLKPKPRSRHMTMHDVKKDFVPAAGHNWLLPFYDPLLRLLGVASALRELVDQAALGPGCRVLDIGCGTGNLAIRIKRQHPEVEVVGLDPDPKALARARRKAENAALSIAFDEGFSEKLPYQEDSFDRVFSSFMFHHLDRDTKRQALAEVLRVLRLAGSLHLLDFGGPKARSDGLLARLLHKHEGLRDNFEDRLAGLLGDTGFVDVAEVASRKTVVGRVAFYCARAATSESRAT